MMPLLRHPRLLVLAVCLSAWLAPLDAWAAKNVILMIADGSGNNTWLATSMYQGKVGRQAYEQAGWLRICCSTYPLNLSHKPTGDLLQNQSLVYDPVKAWDANRKKASAKELALKNSTLKEAKDAMGGIVTTNDFAGYLWLTTTPTDSAAAATALASGQKTFNNAINWSNDDRPLRGETIAEVAKAQGKSVGAITTVEWSDATPAGLGGRITAIAAIMPKSPTRCSNPAHSTSSWAPAIPISTTTAGRWPRTSIATISGWVGRRPGRV